MLDSIWRPLLSLVVDETRTFVGDTSLSDEQTIQLLYAQQLLAKPELYYHLDRFLRHLKVRESPTLARLMCLQVSRPGSCRLS